MHVDVVPRAVQLPEGGRRGWPGSQGRGTDAGQGSARGQLSSGCGSAPLPASSQTPPSHARPGSSGPGPRGHSPEGGCCPWAGRGLT